jgi:hypothetical protein
MNMPLVNAISLNLISVIVRLENACETEAVIRTTRNVSPVSAKHEALAHTPRQDLFYHRGSSRFSQRTAPSSSYGLIAKQLPLRHIYSCRL